METELKLAVSVFTNSLQGILIASSENVIIDVSPSFTRITGYSRNDVIGKNPKILSSGKHNPEFYADMWESIKKHDFWSGEIWNRKKNGNIYPENLSIIAVRNSDNHIQHYVAFFSDITALKTHETKLIDARKQAEAATIAKSRFLATMSHEIRTPMNGILGMAQLLSMADVSDSDRINYSQIIIKSGNVLLNLLNDILDLSKVEAGKIELEKVPTLPERILEETKFLFLDCAKKKSLDFKSKWLGPINKYYMCDPHRLRQMLSNLVSNAVKFTQCGKIDIEAKELTLPDNSLMLEFSVNDTGIGIPQEKISNLFDPFSQVESTTFRKFGGTGLGLSIVANLSKIMGGEFGVSSTLHKGSRFWFTISTEIPSDQQLINTSKIMSEQVLYNEPNSFKEFTFSQLKGLVVDDDPVNRLVIEKFLLKFGVQVELIENGLQALNLIFMGKSYDFILMDLQMPIMDGYTTIQQIRKLESELSLTRAYVVAFTADAFEETKKNCFSKGMDDILLKPVSLNKLHELLMRVRSINHTS